MYFAPSHIPQTLSRGGALLQVGEYALDLLERGAEILTRTRVVSATVAGRGKRAEAERLWKRAQLEVNARLGDDRVVRLHDLLEECLALMDADDE